MKGSVEQDRQRRVLDWSDGPGQDVVSTEVAGILALLHELLVLQDPRRWSRLQRTGGNSQVRGDETPSAAGIPAP